jgi:hypothetical protein
LSADTRTLLLALAVAAGTLLCGFCIHRHIPLQGLLLSLPLCAAHRYRDLRDLPPGSPLLDGTHLPGLLAVLAHVLLLPAFPLTASACVLYPLVMLLRAPHPWHSRPAVMLLPAALIPAGAGALLLRCRNGNFSATALLVPQTLSWVHAFCAGAAGLGALLLLFFFRDFYIRAHSPRYCWPAFPLCGAGCTDCCLTCRNGSCARGIRPGGAAAAGRLCTMCPKPDRSISAAVHRGRRLCCRHALRAGARIDARRFIFGNFDHSAFQRSRTCCS